MTIKTALSGAAAMLLATAMIAVPPAAAEDMTFVTDAARRMQQMLADLLASR